MPRLLPQLLLLLVIEGATATASRRLAGSLKVAHDSEFKVDQWTTQKVRVAQRPSCSLCHAALPRRSAARLHTAS